MSEVASLIERSRAPGRLVERRRFTLSREKAIEKMREFSLRSPQTWILELVQAAVFAGARWIAIDISSERVFFAWIGGRHPQPADLERIFDFLFLDRADPATRHVVQLAIGLNALLQSRPRRIFVESGDGSAAGTVRLELGRDGQGQIGRPESPLQGTWLSVEHRSSWGPRFEQTENLPEVQLVETACVWCPVPILLNYRAPFGYRGQKEIVLHGRTASRSFEIDGRRGALALPANVSEQKEGIAIVVGGVIVCRRKLPQLGVVNVGGQPQALTGVIADDRLRKTADQGDIVEDERFIEMLHAVQPEAAAFIRSLPGMADWRPPALPPRPRSQGPASSLGPRPAATPPPDPLPQVPPRPPLPLSRLSELPPELPIFWSTPGEAERLGRAADPGFFPFLLLVLDEGASRGLEERLGPGRLARLRSGAEAEFLKRSLDQRSRTREVLVPLRPQDGLGGAGRLILRLHLAGPLPAYTALREGELPLLVRRADRALLATALGLRLRGLSLVLELEAGSFDMERMGRALIERVLEEAIGLLPKAGAGPVSMEDAGLEDAGLEDAEQALGIDLLALGVRLHFVGGHLVGGRQPGLRFSWPRGWGARADDLAALPLLGAGPGALSFLDLAAVLDGASPVADAWIERPAGGPSTFPIEQRLGLGHLVEAGRPDTLVLAFVLQGGAAPADWARVQAHHQGLGGDVAAVIGLADSLRARVELPPLAERQRLAPGVVLLLRPGEEPPAARQLDQGLRRLVDELRRREIRDEWPEAGEDPEDRERLRQLGRLALIALALRLGEVRVPILRGSDGHSRRRLEILDAPDGPRVLARHGVTVVDTDVVLLSPAELRVLREGGLRPRLRLDDAPETWRPDPQPGEEWLLIQEIASPTLAGWLGLRRDHDPTAEILVQQSGELLVLDDDEALLPCHGLLWSLGGSDRITPRDRAALVLARAALVQRLAALLEGPEAADREQALPYAIDLAVEAWAAGRDERGSLAARLLEGITLRDPAGAPLGRLGAWLAMRPEERPLPAGPAARHRHRQRRRDEEGPADDRRSPRAELAWRLQRALATTSAGSRRVELHAHPDAAPLVRTGGRPVDGAPLVLSLSSAHPLARAALEGDREAQAMVLLELARQLVAATQPTGGPGLLVLQEALLAQLA